MEIRRQKEAGERLQPSASLIDRSQMLTKEFREKLLNKAAELVDENYAGRSEMCLQFADLLHRALMHLQFPSRGVVGRPCIMMIGAKNSFGGNTPGCAWVKKRLTERIVSQRIH